MAFFCILIDDYLHEVSEHGVGDSWWECDSWCNDPDDAARNFMESRQDADGEFGIGNQREQLMRVFVYDSYSDLTQVVEIRPNPRPAYSNTVLEPDESLSVVNYEHPVDADLKELPKPSGYS